MRRVLASWVFFIAGCSTRATTLGDRIDDPTTAMKIGSNAMIQAFGKEKIARFEPYRAHREGKLWVVVGSLPKGWIGGTPVAEIDSGTGQILRIYQEE